MSEVLDTVMNLFVFAFIGLLVWLYFKEPHSNVNTEEKNGTRDVLK